MLITAVSLFISSVFIKMPFVEKHLFSDISRVTFKTEQLKKYFPKDYTVEKMKREIIDILKIWMDKYWDL